MGDVVSDIVLDQQRPRRKVVPVRLSRECFQNVAEMSPNPVLVVSIGEDTGMAVTLRGIEKAGHVASYVERATNTK